MYYLRSKDILDHNRWSQKKLSCQKSYVRKSKLFSPFVSCFQAKKEEVEETLKGIQRFKSFFTRNVLSNSRPSQRHERVIELS